MYVARLMWEKLAQGKERDNRLQLKPNTQQFVGDKVENRRIKEEFGTHQNLRAALMNSVATRLRSNRRFRASSAGFSQALRGSSPDR